jgi:uncharacterized protein
MSAPSDKLVVKHTHQWLERAVIGLNLCPFAKAVHQKGQIRWVVSAARTRERLLRDLTHEMQHLHACDAAATDTTLLIHPHVLRPFARYNDFLDPADALLVELKLDGILQVASFHPQYRFAGLAADDMANFSNRSPYPMLHLLRESSVARAVQSVPDAARIFERNIQLLRKLGAAGWHTRMG